MKNRKRVSDYNRRKAEQIMFGQALNNAHKVADYAARPGRYKHMVRSLFETYCELRQELLIGGEKSED